jgi:excisionase family DNA binding protein
MQHTLLTAKAVGQLLSLSKRTVSRLQSAGKLPAAVRVGGAVRWRYGDIERWIDQGCPERKRFEAMSGGEK